MKMLYMPVFFCTALFLVSSCSTHSNKYYPVIDHSPRISTLGFHILPPPGSNWFEKHVDDSLYYFKRTTPTTYALTTQATELVFQDSFILEQDFLEYVKTQKSLDEISLQYRNSTADYSVEEADSSLCVRYSHKYNDYSTEGKGGYDYVRVVNKGRVCLHPDSARIGIDIHYIEKFIPEANNPSFSNEGEIFLSGLNFLKPASI